MTTRPAIEIVGPWLHNSGDVLNLWSIVRQLGEHADLAVSSTLGLDALPDEPPLHRVRWRYDRAALSGAWRARSLPRLLRLAGEAATLTAAPDSKRVRSRGVVAGHRLAALLDCSGFAYGDVWGVGRARKRAAYYEKVRRCGALVVMLPQAFGPFDDAEKRPAYQRLFAACDAIYARDTVSLEHLRAAGCEDKARGPIPDITHLLPGAAPPDAEAWRRCVCVVPNARMLDRTDDRIGERYTDFLLRAIATIRTMDLTPCLIVHEVNDRALADEIAQRAGGSIAVFTEDAIRTKGMLGASHAVIGSRYHALISALSQGVPTMGTTWSHKYDALFADYGCAEHLLPLADEGVDVESRVAALIEPARRDALHERLAARAALQRTRVRTMWREVCDRIGPGVSMRASPRDEPARAAPSAASSQNRAVE